MLFTNSSAVNLDHFHSTVSRRQTFLPSYPNFDEVEVRSQRNQVCPPYVGFDGDEPEGLYAFT